jgi:hypothetical protein
MAFDQDAVAVARLFLGSSTLSRVHLSLRRRSNWLDLLCMNETNLLTVAVFPREFNLNSIWPSSQSISSSTPLLGVDFINSASNCEARCVMTRIYVTSFPSSHSASEKYPSLTQAILAQLQYIYNPHCQPPQFTRLGQLKVSSPLWYSIIYLITSQSW